MNGQINIWIYMGALVMFAGGSLFVGRIVLDVVRRWAPKFEEVVMYAYIFLIGLGMYLCGRSL